MEDEDDESREMMNVDLVVPKLRPALVNEEGGMCEVVDDDTRC